MVTEAGERGLVREGQGEPRRIKNALKWDIICLILCFEINTEEILLHIHLKGQSTSMAQIGQ